MRAGEGLPAVQLAQGVPGERQVHVRRQVDDQVLRAASAELGRGRRGQAGWRIRVAGPKWTGYVLARGRSGLGTYWLETEVG